MNKKLKKILMLLFISICFISCGKKETAPEAIEKSQVYGEDFRVTIKSAQDWYKAKEFKKNCQFTMQLEYIGEEQEILIHHGDPLGAIGVESLNGKCIVGGWAVEHIRRNKILKKGKPYRISFEADDLKFWIERLQEADKSEDKESRENLHELFEISVIKNGTLKKGTYEAVASMGFSVGEGEEEEEYTVRLPLTFEIR